MANDISHARPLFHSDPLSFRQMLTASAASRNLPGAMLIDKDRNILESAQTGIQQAFTTPPQEFLNNVDENKPQISVFTEANYVAAVIRLRGFTDTFLYVARVLDPRVVAQLRQTQASVAEYAQLESRKLGIQVAFALMFAVIALTILMASVLIGLNFANRLVAPIRRLMSAANIVSTGDLNVQVPVLKSEGDLAQLGETFNKMTQELRSQRDELVNASELIDSRRRFIEAVLSSASAGIIGVDASGSIGILNRSAEKLIGNAGIRGAGSSAVGGAARTRRHDEDRARGHAEAGAGPDHHQPRRPRAQSVGPRQRRTDQPVAGQLHHHARRHYRSRLRAAHLGLGRRRPPHRA